MPNTTNTFTRFTVPSPESELLLSAEDENGWTRVVMGLETAGPVAVGTRADIVPVVSGKGILLPTDRDITFTLSPGDRLYVASDSINRIRVTTEPIPWLEVMLYAIQGGFDRLASVFSSFRRAAAPAPQLTKVPCPPPGIIK